MSCTVNNKEVKCLFKSKSYASIDICERLKIQSFNQNFIHQIYERLQVTRITCRF